MSSDEAMSYAKREEESAKTLQSDIQSRQAEINALQKDISSKAGFDKQEEVSALQKDIDSKNGVISGLQERYQRHVSDAQRLRQQSIDEQQQEQQEQMRQLRENEESLKEKVAEEAAERGLFG